MVFFMQYILLVILSVSLIGCQSFRTGRKPQSAGFSGYCPTCVVENIDKDLAKLNNLVKVDHITIASYTTDMVGKCIKGFTVGRFWGASELQDPYKECLNKTALLRKASYLTHTEGKCMEGFTVGRFWKSEANEGFTVDGQFLRTNDYKECIRVKPLYD